MSVPTSSITVDLLKKLLSGKNGISTSSFRIYEDGAKTLITLNNFCTLQDMGPEDHDDILSLAGYLMADYDRGARPAATGSINHGILQRYFQP